LDRIRILKICLSEEYSVRQRKVINWSLSCDILRPISEVVARISVYQEQLFFSAVVTFAYVTQNGNYRIIE
jgi:hypothetical protein